MSGKNIQFKWLDTKIVGNDTIVVRLEDGTVATIKVDVEKAGVSSTEKNMDGNPIYLIQPAFHIKWKPKDRTFYAPPPPTPVQAKPDTGVGVSPGGR